MSANINVKQTNRFIEPGLYIAFGATALVILALIASAFFEKVLFSKNIAVSEEEVTKIEALKIAPQPIGALRIDAKAIIPDNRWVAYEIQLLDKQGKLIASAEKQAWRESGTWYEDGESGSWNEDDLEAGLDVRAQKDEEVTIAISVLGYGDSSGREFTDPVPFNVKVSNGVIDTRHLWPGLFGTLALTVMSAIAVPLTGKKVISKTINDSDPSDRATLGGANNLVSVKVDVKSDETSPPTMQARLTIKNSYGEQLYDENLPLNLNFHREDGKLERVTGKLKKFFILEPKDSYGFHVEIIPDAQVDRTTLTVRDGTRTRGAVEVVHISSSITDS
ncbi:hypothetical protein [Rivularia sp. UHCC 0363]|uniref:hypothetical protein n=1 Tax=Rivularia sp. UHCC 0363 TaxID=3110244 RepID=UPI002B1F0CB7|nr:hypothetical protein [Rivularia sp. UHCC 0363]MEA5597025.1 hypothetical protein [Rivularia sp. UHCC 0363]